jgi:NAD(P)-dependent dehydrogenase (short-subunit alcohol dehydrogenase family)
VPEEPVHAALDERVARTGQRHVAEPAVGTRPLPAHQALAFGPGDARIISFSSIAARRGAGSYGAAKAAVEAWTADIARDLGPRGITANVVSPGLTLGSEFFRDTLTEARKQRLIAETDNGRPGTTADVAALVTFLASPSAGHVTGQVIHVNGGAYLGR